MGPGLQLMAGAVVFWGAFLLFAVEPMAAKVLLPVLGGASGVWLACLFFFQMVLLLGYGYAHWMVGRAGGMVGRVHAGLLGCGVLGLGVAAWGFSRWGAGMAGWAGRHPAWAVPVLLGCGVGVPFFLLSATSPLVQGLWGRRAVAGSGGDGATAPLGGEGGSGEGAVPYWMFGLSNVGSLLGLGLYPTAVEPWLTLRQQEVGWAAGFVGYAGLMGWLVWQLAAVGASDLSKTWTGADAGSFDRLGTGTSTVAAASFRRTDAVCSIPASNSNSNSNSPRMAEVEGGRDVARRTWRWRGMVVCLGAVASAQMGAVTGHLTQNVAAIPMLWVLPLGVYLLSFVVAFEAPGWYRRSVLVRLMVVMLASLGYLLSKTDVSLPIALGIGFFLLEMGVACWFCHAEVYRLRPMAKGGLGSRAATEFYLLLAGGGALGTFCVGVLSPLLFRANYDLALVFAATAAMALSVTWEEGWGPRMLWTVSTAGSLALVVLLERGYAKGSVVELRNFYGALRVRQSNVPPVAGVSRLLLNGQIEHGMQWFGGDWRTVPMTYYAEDSGVGRLLRGCCAGRAKRVGVVGLGAGTLAAYGRAGDAFRFYEINPLVTRVARELFTYERDSGARVEVVEGDARVSLAGEGPQGFDVLAVDAFSGDAIPVHLLTREAVELYRRHLAPGGVIAFHVSNQYLDLEPVLREVARAEGMEAREVVSASDDARGEYKARWVLLAGDAGVFARAEMEGWRSGCQRGERCGCGRMIIRVCCRWWSGGAGGRGVVDFRMILRAALACAVFSYQVLAADIFRPSRLLSEPSSAPASLSHQQIVVKIRNGKTGLPIWLASPYVFVGKTDPARFMESYRRTKLWGDARVDVSGANPREIRVWVDFIHRDCRYAEGSAQFPVFDFAGRTLAGTEVYAVDQILSEGIVAPNLCSSKTQSPEPGVITIYVIPATFRELWDS